MNLATVAACAEILIGVGAVLWGTLLTRSCRHEHRRSRTVEMEILDRIELSAGTSYRLSPVEGRTNGPGTEPPWVALTPRKFGDRAFPDGGTVLVDYDPGQPAFCYPPGAYPRLRLWPLALAAAAAGIITLTFGLINLV
ncbi:hypothetical protein ACFYYH_06500 [Streptomyces sp. NPDC002018]|uniref:hypothetical protein n=1 Tax=Streptomyces sp. NPDC002018 TaxID=3364629 RepID=UPI003692B737